MAETNSARAHQELPRRSSALKVGLRRISASVDQSLDAVQVASELFDEACIRAGLTNDFISQELEVNDGLVSKWRKPHHKELPNIGQLIRLGPVFMNAMSKVIGFRFGARRAAMVALLSAVADLAVCEDEQERVG